MDNTLAEIVDATDNELEDLVVRIDHSTSARAILEDIATHVSMSFEIEGHDSEEVITIDGEVYNFPWTDTIHDKFVAVSSTASILEDRYAFWLFSDSIDRAPILLFISQRSSANLSRYENDWIASNLIRFELGFDYIFKIKVPYIGAENYNPSFSKEATKIGRQYLLVSFIIWLSMKIFAISFDTYRFFRRYGRILALGVFVSILVSVFLGDSFKK